MSHKEAGRRAAEQKVNPVFKVEKAKKPIIIRAHHLDRVVQAFLKSPSEAAARMASSVKDNFPRGMKGIKTTQKM